MQAKSVVVSRVSGIVSELLDTKANALVFIVDLVVRTGYVVVKLILRAEVLNLVVRDDQARRWIVVFLLFQRHVEVSHGVSDVGSVADDSNDR